MSFSIGDAADSKKNSPQMEEGVSLRREGDFLIGPEWMKERFGIQHWMERVPQRQLMDTHYGISSDHLRPRPEVWEDPLVNQVIKMDISSFLLAERHSMKNTAKLFLLAPDEKGQIFLSTQVLDESRHFEVFARRLSDLGVTSEGREKLIKRYTSPQIQKFFDLIDEQLDKDNFVGGIIGQNLILEGMAYPIYRYEMKYWSIWDPGLSEIIKGAFADEVYHTSFGEGFLREHLQKDIKLKNLTRKMIHEFHQVMTDVFESIIRRYIGLYQAAANAHMNLVGDIEIFPGHKMATLSEEEQVRWLLHEIQNEFQYRSEKIGL